MSNSEAEPSLALLKKYLNGETTETENVQIEAQLAEDPLLSDALDGLMLVKDTHTVQVSVRRIKAASRKRLFAKTNRREALSRRKSRVSLPENFPMMFVATAAAITLLFATFFVMRDLGFNKNQTEAVAENHSPDENPPVISETPPVQPEPLVTSAEIPNEDTRSQIVVPPVEPTPQKKINAQPPADLRLSTNVGKQNAEKPAVASSVALATPVSGGTDDMRKENNDDETTQPRDRRSQVREETAGGVVLLSDSLGEYMQPEQLSTIPITKENPNLNANGVLPHSPATAEQQRYDDHGKLLKSVAIADLLTEAIALHDEGKYAVAKEKLDEVLQSEPQNQVAKYYKASTLFHQKIYRESITLLKVLVRTPELLFFEDAQWLLAQSYSLMGKNKSAIKVLEEIEAGGGKYQEQARNLRESYGENR